MSRNRPGVELRPSCGGGITKSMAYDKFNPALTRDLRKRGGRTMTSWTDSTNSEATVFAGAKPWHAIAADGDGGWHRTATASAGTVT